MNSGRNKFCRIMLTGAIVMAGTLLVGSKASWTDNIDLKGDLRYRHESIDQEGKETRDRHRIRARLELKAKANDKLDVGLRFASGSSDPVSTNQTLGEGFSSKSAWLDLAYFDWHPTDCFSLMGGKMKNPFYTPGKNQLIWDGDLNPEGMALDVTMKKSMVELFLTGGGFWVEERKAYDDSMLYGIQAGLKVNMGKKAHIRFGGSYYTYSEAKGWAPFFDAGDSFGNSTDEDGLYAVDFSLVEAFADMEFPVGSLPLNIYADYVVNNGADEYDTGYLAGIMLGKTKKPWSFSISYDYREVERDAVVGVFTDSDFAGGGTDAKGHKFGFALQLSKNCTAGATYFMDELGLESESATDYDRLQVDLQLKF
ncbi:putative porin [bacterium]|nr:putative porin [candidate division CSSED10-310 bacterium]